MKLSKRNSTIVNSLDIVKSSSCTSSSDSLVESEAFETKKRSLNKKRKSLLTSNVKSVLSLAKKMGVPQSSLYPKSAIKGSFSRLATIGVTGGSTKTLDLNEDWQSPSLNSKVKNKRILAFKNKYKNSSACLPVERLDTLKSNHLVEDQSSVMTTTNDFNEKSVTQISIPQTHFKPKSGKSNKRGTLKSRNVVSSKFNFLFFT